MHLFCLILTFDRALGQQFEPGTVRMLYISTLVKGKLVDTFANFYIL